MTSLGQLGARFGRWLEQNPEAVAKILLWLDESNEEQGPARSFLDQLMPANWQGLQLGAIERAQWLMDEAGICLVWVPRAEVIKSLLGAADRSGRDAVLLAHAEEILLDVDDTLAAVTHAQLVDLHDSVAEAAAAFRAGLERASQTLSAAAITSVLEDHYGFEFSDARKAFEVEQLRSAGIWASRRVSVQASLHRAILRTDQMPSDGGFNRHATAHSVESDQYSSVNALSGLLLATGAVRELQEMYRVGEWGFAPTPRLRQLSSPSHPSDRAE